MSGLSVAQYFPWRRVKIVHQNVNPEPPSALIRIEPNRRFRAVCHACGGPARTVHSRTRKFVRDLDFGGHQMMLHVDYRKIWCDHCGGVRVEQLDFVDPSQRVTNRLATSRQNLLQALADHNIAIVNLERRKGTLLEYNNILLNPIHDDTELAPYKPVGP